jgi:ubiquinone/menaquinone biosynthesis C-methylase UbiE
MPVPSRLARAALSFDTSETYRRLYQSGPFARFYSRLTGEGSVSFFSQHLQDRLLQYLPPGARVLEVGSGPGLQAIDVARRRPDIRLVASDFSDAFVRLGADNLTEALARGDAGLAAQPLLSFVRADAMDLAQFHDATFDAVYSITAIKHFPDPVRGISECMRVLKVGGRLLLSEFDRDCALPALRNLARLMRLPSLLRPIVAPIIRAGVRREAPSLSDVRLWFRSAGVAGRDYDLEVVKGWPVWIATATKVQVV